MPLILAVYCLSSVCRMGWRLCCPAAVLSLLRHLLLPPAPQEPGPDHWTRSGQSWSNRSSQSILPDPGLRRTHIQLQLPPHSPLSWSRQPPPRPLLSSCWPGGRPSYSAPPPLLRIARRLIPRSLL